MTRNPSTGSIASVISSICDAVHEMAESEEPEAGLRQLTQALGGLGRDSDEAVAAAEIGEGPLENSFQAIKDLARAQAAMAGDDVARAVTFINSASDHLAAAARAVRLAGPESEPVDASMSRAPVQLSVSEALRVPNEDAISDSLRNLLDRSESEAFVIFVDARTGKLCQFIGSKNGPLLLDLPFASLTDEERARARLFLSANGYESTEGGEGFSVELDRDIDAGTRLAMGAFRHVYLADADFSLKIEEN